MGKEKIKQLYCWLMSLSMRRGYVDESDTAKDDECGNIVSMVVIVVVGYILGMYLKCCCMCNLHLLSMSYPQNLLVTVYLTIIYCRTFRDAGNVIWPSWPQIAGHINERYSYNYWERIFFEVESMSNTSGEIKNNFCNVKSASLQKCL